jgi:hemolysin III
METQAELAKVAPKPTLRGMLHQRAIGCALGAGAVLVAMAPTLRAAVGAAVFAASLVTLLTVSATYHRVDWAPGARAWMRRLDHASIFLLIAGTYTPVALLVLSPVEGNQLLWTIWVAAVVGMAVSLLWPGAPKAVNAVLAIGVGWLLVPFMGQIQRSLGSGGLALVVAGGVAYTLGAVAYASKRPNLRPGVFGYHEAFHAMTLVGASLHFAVVVGLVRSSGP